MNKYILALLLMSPLTVFVLCFISTDIIIIVVAAVAVVTMAFMFIFGILVLFEKIQGSL